MDARALAAQLAPCLAWHAPPPKTLAQVGAEAGWKDFPRTRQAFSAMGFQKPSAGKLCDGGLPGTEATVLGKRLRAGRHQMP